MPWWGKLPGMQNNTSWKRKLLSIIYIFLSLLILIFLLSGDFSTVLLLLGMISFIIGVYGVLSSIWRKDFFRPYAMSLTIAVIFLSVAGRLAPMEQGGAFDNGFSPVAVSDKLILLFSSDISAIFMVLGLAALLVGMIGVVNSFIIKDSFRFYALALVLAIVFLLVGNALEPVDNEQVIRTYYPAVEKEYIL